MIQSLPIPPLDMRKLVGPTELGLFDNPTGQLVLPNVPAENYETVFDFGCGCGRIARQLMQQVPPPRQYTGIDLHRGMIKWCRKNLQPFAEGFEFQHHDVRSTCFNPGLLKPLTRPFPARERSFKLVIAWSVFTHLTEEQASYYLSETERILRHDGIVASTWFLFDKRYFPMMQDFQNALYINPVDLSNAVIFDFDWLRATAKRNRLKIISIVPPAIRGFHWFVYMASTKSLRPEVDFPEDTAPFGLSRPPVLERDMTQIGLEPAQENS